MTYDLATGEMTPWPLPSYETRLALLTHDGLPPDRFECSICVQPELGFVADMTSHNLSPARFDFDLLDFENAELLAHVATFETQREPWVDYTIEVLDVFPLKNRGDYLLFVQERTGSTLEDLQLHILSAWNPAGEMPFTVVDGQPANILPNVMPMAISPDGASFVGLQLLADGYTVGSALVVDLATAEIIYEYPLSDGTAYFFPPRMLEGVHMVWPAE